MKNESLITTREALSNALRHYYNGLDPAEAAETFLSACSDAIVEAYERGDGISLPLQFVTSNLRSRTN